MLWVAQASMTIRLVAGDRLADKLRRTFLRACAICALAHTYLYRSAHASDVLIIKLSSIVVPVSLEMVFVGQTNKLHKCALLIWR